MRSRQVSAVCDLELRPGPVPGGLAELAPSTVCPSPGFTPSALSLASHAGQRTRPCGPGKPAGPLARSGSLRFAPSVPLCHAVKCALNWCGRWSAQREREWDPDGASGRIRIDGRSAIRSAPRRDPDPRPRARRGRGPVDSTRAGDLLICELICGLSRVVINQACCDSQGRSQPAREGTEVGQMASDGRGD